MKLKIINGPNLNLLGKREPSIYGDIGFEVYLTKLKEKYKTIEIEYYQSNIEGEIINEIQKSITKNINGVIINAGAYSHYSYAIRDAIKATEITFIEVHISNIYKREEFRKKSVISEVCTGIISGFGLKSYQLAVEFFLTQI